MVMGDIHGAYKALRQCMDRSGFDYENDTLIQLGDVTDGFSEVFECVEELLKISRLIPLKGNHDDWLLDFIHSGYASWSHGGRATIQSYAKHLDREIKILSTGNGICKTSLNPNDIPLHHRNFFCSQQLFYIDEANNCFVHAGFNRQLSFLGQRPQTYYWDRELWLEALQYHTLNHREPQPEPFYIRDTFHEIYIGHTPTTKWGTDKPMRAVNVLNMDTGAGHHGRLTILDIGTKEYWQSDLVTELYGKAGR